jgi:hypothetical protein
LAGRVAGRVRRFIYYGDNKRPGHELHETQRCGNLILRNLFEALHAKNRIAIPPIFIFTKTTTGRDAVFRGLAVPGFAGIPQTEDLVAVWKARSWSVSKIIDPFSPF